MDFKQELREGWKNGFPKDETERKRRTLPILDVLSKSELFLEASVVALYAATASEVDLKALWHRRPHACVFPRTLPLTKGLEFYRIGDWSDLKPGYGGILEPNVSTGFKVSTWDASSIILVPGIAFDKFGGRVGRGKGYYDRFLANLPPHVKFWGVCFHEQFKDERFPLEPTDVRMHAVITDEGFFAVDL